jgi:hypothetical protein
MTRLCPSHAKVEHLGNEIPNALYGFFPLIPNNRQMADIIILGLWFSGEHEQARCGIFEHSPSTIFCDVCLSQLYYRCAESTDNNYCPIRVDFLCSSFLSLGETTVAHMTHLPHTSRLFRLTIFPMERRK